MSIYDSRLWMEDIDKVLEIIPEMEMLEGKSVLITGISGLVCSAIADVLLRYNETHENKIYIIAAGRRFESVRSRFDKMTDRPDFAYVQYDALKTDNSLEVKADYIIHGAGNASPDVITREPVETMTAHFWGLKYLLDQARIKGTKRLLYISSSEVYGIKEDNKPYEEGQYGYIDLLNSRNSYSVAKRAAETLCASYAYEYGIDSVIVRPGHIYGPNASKNDNRVSSLWAHTAAEGKDIFMKSDGAQIRSYCYSLDCASAILKVLLVGKKGKAYNISNPNSIISIKRMAEIITRSANVQIKIDQATEEEKKGFNPMSNSSLNSKSLEELGWKGCFDAETGFEHTIRILKQLNLR